jgi:HEAT repeat protein
MKRRQRHINGILGNRWRAKVYERMHPLPANSKAPREPLELETTFGVLPDPDGIPVLVALLDDDDDQVRYFACNALVAHGPKSAPAVPALRKMLRHEVLYERRNAVNVLAAIGPNARAAIPDLIHALKDEDTWVTYYAAAALGRIGVEAREAIPALRELRQSDRAKICYLGPGKEDPFLARGMDTVGYAVDWALKEISPEEAKAVDP